MYPVVLPVEDVRAVDVENMRPVSLQPAVILFAQGIEADVRQVKRTANTRSESPVDQMRLI